MACLTFSSRLLRADLEDAGGIVVVLVLGLVLAIVLVLVVLVVVVVVVLWDIIVGLVRVLIPVPVLVPMPMPMPGPLLAPVVDFGVRGLFPIDDVRDSREDSLLNPVFVIEFVVGGGCEVVAV